MTTMMSPKRIVCIIEDESSLLQALRDKLSREGFSTLTAKDGEEGLAIVLREHPDLILLDVVMPKMDGMTMLGKLREDAWGKTAKVIVLSNLGDADNMSAAVIHGSSNYLVKSDWRLEDIVVKVKEALEMV